jgi:allantoin racemase
MTVEMRIKVVVPNVITTVDWRKEVRQVYDKVKEPETNIDIVALERGIASIEQYYDHEIAACYALQEVEKSEKEGYDAVIVYCAADPGVFGAREALHIPVMGLFEPSLHLASMLGRKFSVISPMKRTIPLQTDLVSLYGLEKKCASIRAVEIPVLGLDDQEQLAKALYEESTKAINEDGADVIVFGCGGMIDVASDLSKKLGVPVVDPGIAALKMCELLVRMKLSQSKLWYAEPRQKKRILD